MPPKKQNNKQKAAAPVAAPLPTLIVEQKETNIEELREQANKAELFSKWAAAADDDEAPALLYYPKPAGMGKGVWGWKLQAKHDALEKAKALAAALAARAADPSYEEETPRYVPVPESAEETAARQARYAAEGRDSHGTLLTAQSCGGCFNCAWAARPKQAPWTDAECQAAVDLWGPRLGAELILMRNEGRTLDELYGPEMQEAWDEWRAARERTAAAVAAAEKAQMEANWKRACVEQAIVEARRNLKRGERVQKNGRICTRCYSCVGDKRTAWEDGGHKARPSTLHVSDVCFTHQAFLEGKSTDDCAFLHHGDAGWHAEWDRNFLWDPTAPTAIPVARHVRSREGPSLVCISESSSGRIPVHLGGKPVAAPAFAERVAPNRFAALGAAPPPQPQKAWGRK